MPDCFDQQSQLNTASAPAIDGQACPTCKSSAGQVKAGRNSSGSQRMKCKACGRKYTPEPNPHCFSPEIRSRAVQLYLEGLSFREIARELHVNHQSVINWINDYARNLPRPVAHSLSRRLTP